MLKSPPAEFNEAKLLGLDLQNLISITKDLAPTTWTIASAAATTPLQKQRNKYKESDPVSCTFYIVAYMLINFINIRLS